MLKRQTLVLTGRDAGKRVTLRELPALVADRAARAILAACDLSPDGGIVALTFKHLRAARAALGEAALDEFAVFVDADYEGQLRDFRNITRLQDAALVLHAGFIATRPAVEIPVTLQAEGIRASGDARASFCSPFIAAVLDSRLASYVDLETVLGTEDAYNLAELLNVAAVREWQAAKRKPSP